MPTCGWLRGSCLCSADSSSCPRRPLDSRWCAGASTSGCRLPLLLPLPRVPPLMDVASAQSVLATSLQLARCRHASSRACQALPQVQSWLHQPSYCSRASAHAMVDS